MTDRSDIQRARRYIISRRITPSQFVALFPQNFVNRKNINAIAQNMNRRELEVTGWRDALQPPEPERPAPPPQPAVVEQIPVELQKANLDRAISTYEFAVATRQGDITDRLTLARLREERAKLDVPQAETA